MKSLVPQQTAAGKLTNLRSPRTCSVAIVSIAFLSLLFSATPASAETLAPWWHIAFEGRPAAVQPGAGQDAVQEVKFSATGGEFCLTSQQVYGEHLIGSGADVEECFAFDASDAVLREGLERIWGTGSIEVTGGPHEAGQAVVTELEPYLIKFIGSRGDQPVQEMINQDSELTGGPSKTPVVTELSEGRSDGEIVVSVSNLGDENADSENVPVTVADKLPRGLRAIKTEEIQNAAAVGNSIGYIPGGCVEPAGPCTSHYGVPPYTIVEMVIYVEAVPGAESGEVNEALVSGGGAPTVARREPVSLSDASVRFGVQNYEMNVEEAGGVPDTQAGSHPFQLTTTLSLNQDRDVLEAPAVVKDLSVKLPPGLIGNPTPFPRCSVEDFIQEACPADTAVGVAQTKAGVLGLGVDVYNFTVPIFNLVPAVGEPARFAFHPPFVYVYLNTSVRTGGDYGVTVSVKNISQLADLLSSQVTFWGVPGDPRHNDSRGNACVDDALGYTPVRPCEAASQADPPPLLSLPTSCTGALQTSVEADSWAEPANRLSFGPNEPMQALDGCNRLPFSPEVGVAPDETTGSTPSGLKVDVHVPQSLVLNGTALAESNVKGLTVALPEGLALNPAAGDGLQACSDAQIGFEGFKELNVVTEPGVRTAEFSPEEPSCPNASKIADVTIKTPLLPNSLKGFVYLAAPQNFRDAPPENPFESLIAMYLVAQDPVSGTLVKLSGKVALSPSGQVVTTFENNPQLAFEDAELEFFGGDRAPLATPARCGSYTTDASIVPWSGNPASTPSSSFQITSGPNGSPCSDPLPFSPTLQSGTTNINAGSFSDLTTTLSREDGQQSIQSVTLHYPAGVSGLLSGVKLCGEAQANEGTCGSESEVGETIVSVGLGGDPFTVTGGKVYITGPYEGAPFGLSIVNPAKAGPFDLQEGRPVVVRAKVEVNPATAALTITTDPPGSPHAIPTIIEGIPLQIKHVNVLVNRSRFTFNPTNCNPQSITGAIDSAEGASSPVSVPFQVTNCASLKFAPKFAVSTSAKTSRASGASLAVKLSYPNSAEGAFDGPEGAYTNIARVKVELPKLLPSRLTTLQKACTAAQFEANPAGCPAASIVGHAKAITPLIPVPLEGPAYFVSHGGEAFPSLVIVLQGYGVTVDLVGTTFINKAGITSSTFKTVPDAPVGSFELTLPEGAYSALAAHGNLCKDKLTMPTEFIAQNGAEIHESTKISVTGCGKVKKSSKKKAHHQAKHKHKGKRG